MRSTRPLYWSTGQRTVRHSVPGTGPGPDLVGDNNRVTVDAERGGGQSLGVAVHGGALDEPDAEWDSGVDEFVVLADAADTVAAAARKPVPTFSECVSMMSASVSAGPRQAYSSYWHRGPQRSKRCPVMALCWPPTRTIGCFSKQVLRKEEPERIMEACFSSGH